MASLHEPSEGPDCTNTDVVPSVTLRTDISAIPFGSDRLVSLCQQSPENCQFKFVPLVQKAAGNVAHFASCRLRSYSMLDCFGSRKKTSLVLPQRTDVAIMLRCPCSEPCDPQ